MSEEESAGGIDVGGIYAEVKVDTAGLDAAKTGIASFSADAVAKMEVVEAAAASMSEELSAQLGIASQSAARLTLKLISVANGLVNIKTPPALKQIADQAAKAGVNLVSAANGADDFASGMSRVESAASTAGGTVSALTTEARDLRVGLGAAASASVKLTGVLDDVAAAAPKATGELNSVGGAAQITGDDFNTTALRADALAASLRGVASAGNSAAASVSRAGGSSARVASITTVGRIGRSAYSGASTAAGLLTLGAAGAVTEYANFSDEAQNVVGNTNMSGKDQTLMRSTVLDLMRTGADQKQLLEGFMRIENFGYKGSDAASILRDATKLAVGTHAPIDETAEAGAGLMNAYGHHGAKYSRPTLNTLHAGAVASNMNLTQFERNSQRTFGLAANYNVPMADVTAGYAALVQHRLSPARADTQIAGMLQQIAAPSDKATAEAKKLGINDFNRAGLQTPGVGLYGIVGQVREAIKSLPLNDQSDALKRLFNNKQGGIGAQFLTGVAAPTYSKIYNDPKQGTRAAAEGKVDFTASAYKGQMQQPTQQLKALAGSIRADLIQVGPSLVTMFTAAIPAINALANGLTKILGAFGKLPQPVKEFVGVLGGLKILSWVSGGLLDIGKAGPVLATAFRLGKLAMLELMPAIEAVGAAIAAVGAPILIAVAAVALLAVAWATDFGHVREVTASAVAAVKNYISQIPAYIKSAFLSGMRELGEITRSAWDGVKIAFAAGRRLVLAELTIFTDLLHGDWSGAWNTFVGLVAPTWNRVKGAVQIGVTNAENVIASIVTYLTNLGPQLLKSAESVGGHIASGLKNGIESGWGKVTGTIASLTKQGEEAFNQGWERRSPSRVTFRIGVDIAAGLANGISSGTGRVTAAISAQGKAAADAFNKARLAHRDARLAKQGYSREQIAGYNAEHPASGRSPQPARGEEVGLTPAQRNALAVQEGFLGGSTWGRKEVERNRTLDQMRDNGASPAELVKAAEGFNEQIKAIKAKLLLALRPTITEKTLANPSAPAPNSPALIDQVTGERSGLDAARYNAENSVGAGSSMAYANTVLDQRDAHMPKGTDEWYSASNEARGAEMEAVQRLGEAFRGGSITAGQYTAQLAAINAQAGEFPAVGAAVSQALKDVAASLNPFVAMIERVKDNVADTVGSSFTDVLEQNEQHQKGKRAPSLWNAFKRDEETALQQKTREAAGQAVASATKSLEGNIVGGLFGSKANGGGGGKPDGSPQKPLHVTVTNLPGGSSNGATPTPTPSPLDAARRIYSDGSGQGQAQAGVSPQIISQINGSGAGANAAGATSGGAPDMSSMASMFGGGGDASAMGGASGMSGFGASAVQAAPWIAASMAISKALGGQKTFGGRLFSGGLLNAFWKKDPIHLATGGVVPGGSAASAQDEGDGDTVPAKLTPGELVVPKIEVPDALKAMSGKSYSAQWDSARGGSSVPVPDSSSTASAVQNIGCHTVVNMHGDVYGVDDLDSKIHKAVKSANKEQGWDTMKSRRTATPSSR